MALFCVQENTGTPEKQNEKMTSELIFSLGKQKAQTQDNRYLMQGTFEKDVLALA